ncbi:MAG: flagellar biosynthetic protein FliO [Nibricoccus sp.]
MIFQQAFTSVTRWLLVVIGCVVLATAQPMSAASDEAPAKGTNPSPGTIIYPKTADAGAQPSTAPDTSRSWVMMVALLLAAGGAWVLLQRRKSGPVAGRGRKLQIEETRPLGNRQYLVVADYEGKKFLLGVTPGQIQMLTPLNAAQSGQKEDVV